MEIQPEPERYRNSEMAPKLPNSGVVFYLGLFSMLLCWFYGFLSIILAIIALVLSSSAEKEYRRFPDSYSPSSYSSMRLGRTFAIIGICFGILSFLFILVWILVFGAVFFSFF